MASSTAGQQQSLDPTPTLVSVDAKIMADLDILTEKINLCDSMLRPGGGDPAPSIQTDDTLLSVIGFLEACAPRMVELVEAAAQGALQETALMKCLEVNDRLTKLLSDIDTVALTETPASTTAASAPTDSTADLLFAEEEETTTTPTTTDDDPFGEDVFKSEASAPPALEGAKSEDEFDSFFNERTTGSN
jgi:hypothetical protein